MNKSDFSKMTDIARQIKNIALLLRSAAESGQLFDLGEDAAEDAAAMIQEKAAELETMLQKAQDAE